MVTYMSNNKLLEEN